MYYREKGRNLVVASKEIEGVNADKTKYMVRS
jgi:hypothetical protein